MRFENSPNAAKMRNWVMFALATNQIVPNRKQVATRSMPALGQPIPVDNGPIEQDICIICMEDVSANNVENPLIINLNRNCTHKLHLIAPKGKSEATFGIQITGERWRCSTNNYIHWRPAQFG
jgi:hypothetical protein